MSMNIKTYEVECMKWKEESYEKKKNWYQTFNRFLKKNPLKKTPPKTKVAKIICTHDKISAHSFTHSMNSINGISAIEKYQRHR